MRKSKSGNCLVKEGSPVLSRLNLLDRDDELGLN